MSSHTSPATTPPSSPIADYDAVSVYPSESQYQGAKASVDVPIELMLKQVEAQLERKSVSLTKATDLIIQLLKDKKEDDQKYHELAGSIGDKICDDCNYKMMYEKMRKENDENECEISSLSIEVEELTAKILKERIENEKLKARIEDLEECCNDLF
jgi:hypothetical protein